MGKGKPPEKPFRSLPSLGENLFKGFQEAFGPGDDPYSPELAHFSPQVDIYSTREALIIEVEIPGVDIKDIEITLNRGNLLVRGVKKEVHSDEETGNYVCMERSFGRYYRSVEIPFPVNTQNIKAAYSSGILTIEAPRVADKRGLPKRIEIETE